MEQLQCVIVKYGDKLQVGSELSDKENLLHCISALIAFTAGKLDIPIQEVLNDAAKELSIYLTEQMKSNI